MLYSDQQLLKGDEWTTELSTQEGVREFNIHSTTMCTTCCVTMAPTGPLGQHTNTSCTWVKQQLLSEQCNNRVGNTCHFIGSWGSACVGQHLPPTYPPKVEEKKQEPWWNLDEEDFTTKFSDDSYPTMIYNHILSHFRSEVPDLGRLIRYSFKILFFLEIGSKLNCSDTKML